MVLVPFRRKLLWSEIREIYQGQWVELHDVDWDPRVSIPKRARVQNAASDRDTLLQLTRANKSKESVILYIAWADTVISFDIAGAAA